MVRRLNFLCKNLTKRSNFIDNMHFNSYLIRSNLDPSCCPQIIVDYNQTNVETLALSHEHKQQYILKFIDNEPSNLHVVH